MRYEDGYVRMTREEIASGNLKHRIILCLEQLGPLTAVEMNNVCCGATLGERTKRVSHACWTLRRDGILKLDIDTRKWRINNE